MKRILIIFFLAPLALTAQQSSKKKKCDCAFSSIMQVGLLEGSGSSSFNVQSINGMRYKTWFAGIGVGLDKYRTRSIPVFFDIRKDLLKKWNTPFLYSDIGVNVPWAEDKDKRTGWQTNDFGRGLYYDGGVGYKLNVGKSRGLLFSAGFSLKKMKETRYTFTTCPFVGPCPELQGERFDFTLKRFSLKAGLQL